MPTLPLLSRSLATHSRSEMIEITSEVQKAVADSKVQDGMLIVFVPHTTAAITINENADPDVKHDLLQKLEMMIPQDERFFQHSEGNSDSHIKTSLVGNSVTVLIEAGKLVLGTWQGIQFCEFDGPRQRQYMIKIVSFD